MEKVKTVAVFLAPLLIAAALFGCGPGTPEECLDRAMLAATAGEWEEALKLASRAEKLAPGNVEALILQAISARKCQKSEVAFEAASRAVETAPGSFAAQYTLGRLCADDPERRDMARRALMSALRLRRGDSDTLVLICNLYERYSMPGHEAFLELLRKDPEYAANPALHNQLGIAYLRRKDLAKARVAFSNAWKYGYNDPQIAYNTAVFFDRCTNSKAAAADLYRRYMKLSAGDGEAARNRELASARLKALSEASR